MARSRTAKARDRVVAFHRKRAAQDVVRRWVLFALGVLAVLSSTVYVGVAR